MSKIFHKVSEFYDGVKTLREQGVFKGEDIGFHCLKDLYSVKLGGTSYFYSSPYSGKSMWVWECCMNLSTKYDWNHAVFSPETGTKEEVVAELVFKLTGQELYKNHSNSIDDDMLKKALSFINTHFVFIDADIDYSIADRVQQNLVTVNAFYKAVKDAEQVYGMKLHTTIIDPFNELEHDFKDDVGRQDLYIERMLGIVRRDAVKNQRHNIIVTHVQNQAAQVQEGIRFYPAAHPREIAGGQAWYRKGMMMVSLWRPPYGLKDINRLGIPYEENEFHFIVQKAKPRYCGKQGTGILYYDLGIGRYYEMIEGKRYYAFQYEDHLKKLNQQGYIKV